MGVIHAGHVRTYELDADETEGIGLDSTGRTEDGRDFPFRYYQLTDEERVKFWEYRITSTPQIKTQGHVHELAARLRDLGNAFSALEGTWTSQDLPGDFIVPELGIPITMAVEECSCELWVLAETVAEAGENVFGYVGQHRRAS